MNTFLNSPDLALTVARQTIEERVEHATAVRSSRRARRAARLERRGLSASPTEQSRLPWWAFRFVRPVV